MCSMFLRPNLLVVCYLQILMLLNSECNIVKVLFWAPSSLIHLTVIGTVFLQQYVNIFTLVLSIFFTFSSQLMINMMGFVYTCIPLLHITFHVSNFLTLNLSAPTRSPYQRSNSYETCSSGQLGSQRQSRGGSHGRSAHSSLVPRGICVVFFIRSQNLFTFIDSHNDQLTILSSLKQLKIGWIKSMI